MKSLTYIAQAYRVGPSGERPGICQVRSCGRYCAEKGFQDRVAVKNFLEIFWCARGCGCLERDGREFRLPPGEVCCYFPGERHNVHTDAPFWDYYWMGLDGPYLNELIQAFRLKNEPWQAGKCPEELFEKIMRALSDLSIHGQHLASCFAYELLSRIANGPFHAANDQIEQLRMKMEKEFGKTDFSILKEAGKIGIHRSTLYRLFVSRTGMSPQNYLIACRLREALARLHAGEPLKTIAFECGFSDQNYFTRIFRKKYGIPPAQFRRRC